MTTIIPARILRAHATSRDNRLEELTQAERRQRDRILDHAPSMFVRYGRPTITLANMALALRMAPMTIKKHFCDLDALLFHILVTHLMDIARAIGNIPPGAPDPRAAARAAYLGATRGPFGGLNEMHNLLILERQNLPLDLREEVAEQHRQLAIMCVGDDLADDALAILDAPSYTAEKIEKCLAALNNETASAVPPVTLPKPKPRLIAVPDSPRFLNDDDLDDLTRISGVKIPGGGLINPEHAALLS